MNRTTSRIRVAVGVALGFAAGLALANKVIEGDRMDWTETGLLGWGILAGIAIGFIVGAVVEVWLRRWLTTRTTPWLLLSLALGALCALVAHTVFWDMGSSFLGITRGIAAIGLWNGGVLGLAFGDLAVSGQAANLKTVRAHLGRLHRLQIGVGTTFAFAAGLALGNRTIEGHRSDWTETALLGWDVVVGTAVGFLLGSVVQRWLRTRLTRQTTRWVLLGLALGPLCALMVHTASWATGSGFLGVGLGVAAIGVWSGFLLGLAFGKLSSATDTQGRQAAGARDLAGA